MHRGQSSATLTRAASVVVLVASIATSSSADAHATVSHCSAAQIRVTTDGEDGNFNGMNQSGTRLILRNTSQAACSIPPFATFRFYDKNGARVQIVSDTSTAFDEPESNVKPIPIGRRSTPFRLVLAPKHEATTTLRWIEGPVFEHTSCAEVAFIVLTNAGAPVEAPMMAHVCGPDAKHRRITIGRLFLR